VQWIRNAKINSKLLLMILLPMLGLLYLSISAIYEHVNELSEMNKLETLVTLEVSMNDLIHEVQRERSLVSGYIGNKTASKQSSIFEQRKLTDDKTNSLRGRVKSSNLAAISNEFSKNVSDAVAKLDRMAALRTLMDQDKITESEALAYYLDVMDSFFQSMETENKSGTNKQISDMLASYILFSKSKFAVSKERGQLYNALVDNKVTVATVQQIAVVEGEQNIYYTVSSAFATAKARNLYQTIVKGPVIDEIKSMIQQVQTGDLSQPLGINPDRWFNLMSNRIDLLKQVEDGLADELLLTMAAIKKGATESLVYVVILNIIILLVSILVIVVISRMMVAQIRILKNSTELILLGEMNMELDVTTRDEFGDLMGAFNQMVASFREVIQQADRISLGEYEQTISPRSDRDQLSVALIRMLEALKQTTAENERQFWLKTQIARLTGAAQGVVTLQLLGSMLISEISQLVEAGQGILYVKEMKNNEFAGSYILMGSYAFKERKHVTNRIMPGDGLVGQCVLEKKPLLLTQVPGDYIQIRSGLGEATPLEILVLPILFEDEVLAVIELASFKSFTSIQHDLLEQLSSTLGVVLQSVNSRQRTEELLLESQLLTEELQTQQEELRTSNEELEEQTQILRQSEEKMKIQSEELQAINEELEEKTNYLEVQKADIEKQNQFIQLSKQDLEEKAHELELASQYKSEFLANMSHELRTPLNSLLILAKSLASNDEGNLSEDQIESAKIIYSGGLDLLTLINDILDLSKVEAGKLSISMEDVSVDAILNTLQYQFNHVAKDKGLQFVIERDNGVPQWLRTDSQRTEQILKNLLSNAFKFTSSGSVTLQVSFVDTVTNAQNSSPSNRSMLAFSVIDTGIGIPENKQRAIFEAFQQADGTTSRKYGGTGLGLTISRELAKLLGGEIHMQSIEGQGSRFTLYLPQRDAGIEAPGSDTKHRGFQHSYAAAPEPPVHEPVSSEALVASAAAEEHGDFPPIKFFLADDRELIRSPSEEKVILIVEDDLQFAKILMNLIRKKGFKCLAAGDGFSALQLAKQYIPSAILLDLGLPDMDGLKVLDHLKYHNETRHIPVHIVSGKEKKPDSLQRGAIGYLSKPISSEDIDSVFSKIENVLDEHIQQVLVVEDDPGNQKAIHELLKHKQVEIHSVYTGVEALDRLKSQRFDCVILDLKLPDMTGFEMLQQLVAEEGDNPVPPIIINTGKDLSQEEFKELNHFTDSIVIKGANSPDRLLDEVSLFLHSVHKLLPPEQKERIRMVRDSDESLKGRKILLVDDDLRNTFALSKILRKHGLDVIMADNGKMALDKLESETGIELVIMDIMMPIMDGYEAISRIRTLPEFHSLPIIALTAKAMAGDREKCIERGANDYMTKPLDTDKLLSLIRVWLV
jgi:CheY-like chemotaxis protein/signal transduction histidine kinase/HAMP domain-containing protein